MLQGQKPSCVSALNPQPPPPPPPIVVLSQMYFSFKCPNELVPPYLSDYFIRNRTIHTYKTRQSNDIHLPNPKLTLEKKTLLDFQVRFFNNLPTSIKEATSLSIYKNFLNLDSSLIFLVFKLIIMICNFPFRHFLKSLYIILKYFFTFKFLSCSHNLRRAPWFTVYENNLHENR